MDKKPETKKVENKVEQKVEAKPISINIRLNAARKLVREGEYKKDGKNTYSKYDYFTPEMVETIVAEVCEKTGLMPICNFLKDEHGYYQHMSLIDLQTDKELQFVLRTEKGELKATNATQQMGGTDTYSERYLKMKVFQIKDNNLDFDLKDNTEKKPKEVKSAEDLDL